MNAVERQGGDWPLGYTRGAPAELAVRPDSLGIDVAVAVSKIDPRHDRASSAIPDRAWQVLRAGCKAQSPAVEGPDWIRRAGSQDVLGENVRVAARVSPCRDGAAIAVRNDRKPFLIVRGRAEGTPSGRPARIDDAAGEHVLS